MSITIKIIIYDPVKGMDVEIVQQAHHLGVNAMRAALDRAEKQATAVLHAAGHAPTSVPPGYPRTNQPFSEYVTPPGERNAQVQDITTDGHPTHPLPIIRVKDTETGEEMDIRPVGDRLKPEKHQPWTCSGQRAGSDAPYGHAPVENAPSATTCFVCGGHKS